jgi:hypothetical protein
MIIHDKTFLVNYPPPLDATHKLHMITEIKGVWRDEPNVKNLVETGNFDRRLDKFRSMNGQVW